MTTFIAILDTVRLIMLGAVMVLVLYTIKTVRDQHKANEEFVRWLTDQVRITRETHLKILQALKGQSYTGSFGEFDLHTDPTVSTGQILIVDAPESPQEPAS